MNRKKETRSYQIKENYSETQRLVGGGGREKERERDREIERRERALG